MRLDMNFYVWLDWFGAGLEHKDFSRKGLTKKKKMTVSETW